MGTPLEKKSNLVRKRIEGHTFSNEEGEEYEGSKFGGFNEYFRRKKIKLQNLDAEVRAHSDKPPIFKGVVCHVNGYTQPSLNDLHVMIVEHGGGFIQYLDGKTMVTHIIASNLTPKKKEEFRRYRIVKPAWVVDSVKAGRLLPWDSYRVIDEGVGQKVLGFEGGQVVSQAKRKAVGYREQTDTSWYTSQLKSPAPGSSSQTAGRAAKQPAHAQTVTPTEDIEDDEFPSLDITSSMQQALDDSLPTEPVKAAESRLNEVPASDNLLEVKTTLQTPPPSSPTLPPAEPPKTTNTNDATEAVAESAPNGPPPLRPREGSQEPDYSMAVVRDSDVLNAIPAEKLAQMTAEEHNALLLSDPKIRKSTVVHPDFLDQYYRESRLHHLSTWKAELKAQLQALAAEKTEAKKSKVCAPAPVSHWWARSCSSSVNDTGFLQGALFLDRSPSMNDFRQWKKSLTQSLADEKVTWSTKIHHACRFRLLLRCRLIEEAPTIRRQACRGSSRGRFRLRDSELQLPCSQIWREEWNVDETSPGPLS